MRVAKGIGIKKLTVLKIQYLYRIGPLWFNKVFDKYLENQNLSIPLFL